MSRDLVPAGRNHSTSVTERTECSRSFQQEQSKLWPVEIIEKEHGYINFGERWSIMDCHDSEPAQLCNMWINGALQNLNRRHRGGLYLNNVTVRSDTDTINAEGMQVVHYCIVTCRCGRHHVMDLSTGEPRAPAIRRWV